mmetsp:Transcript_38700/g.96202  ORF Transcript_38700/g.96202 Transcript_38700/m.96202 type:complete len:89 (-) Transcript_38700:337-603(-)
MLVYEQLIVPMRIYTASALALGPLSELRMETRKPQKLLLHHQRMVEQERIHQQLFLARLVQILSLIVLLKEPMVLEQKRKSESERATL